MEMIQNGVTEGFLETIRRDDCEQGIPVIACEKPAKEVDAIDMPDLLDIPTQERQEPFRIDIGIPENVRQFGGDVRFPQRQSRHG